MDLSEDDLQQRAEADRREVDPPIEVQTATWSSGGQLDWWVKERQEWWGRVRLTAVNGGSKLSIFVRRTVHSRNLWRRAYVPYPTSLTVTVIVMWSVKPL